jgi:hypothetical protein
MIAAAPEITVQVRLDKVPGLRAERAIRDVDEGTLHTEWCNVPHDHLVSVIGKSQTPGKYEIVVRYVTEWVVEP